MIAMIWARNIFFDYHINYMVWHNINYKLWNNV